MRPDLSNLDKRGQNQFQNFKFKYDNDILYAFYTLLGGKANQALSYIDKAWLEKDDYDRTKMFIDCLKLIGLESGSIKQGQPLPGLSLLKHLLKMLKDTDCLFADIYEKLLWEKRAVLNRKKLIKELSASGLTIPLKKLTRPNLFQFLSPYVMDPPLTLPLVKGDGEMVKYLLDLGANPNELTLNGETMLNIGLHTTGDYRSMCELLLNYGGTDFYSTSCTFEPGDIRKTIKRPLLVSAILDLPETVPYVLEKIGGDINTVCYDEKTRPPLYLALEEIKYGNDTTQIFDLLASSADMDLVRNHPDFKELLEDKTVKAIMDRWDRKQAEQKWCDEPMFY